LLVSASARLVASKKKGKKGELLEQLPSTGIRKTCLKFRLTLGKKSAQQPALPKRKMFNREQVVGRQQRFGWQSSMEANQGG